VAAPPALPSTIERTASATAAVRAQIDRLRSGDDAVPPAFVWPAPPALRVDTRPGFQRTGPEGPDGPLRSETVLPPQEPASQPQSLPLPRGQPRPRGAQGAQGPQGAQGLVGGFRSPPIAALPLTDQQETRRRLLQEQRRLIVQQRERLERQRSRRGLESRLTSDRVVDEGIEEIDDALAGAGAGDVDAVLADNGAGGGEDS
jgi:hypothetical protein